MSSKDNPCRKFQANIFNKSKCQNCFKPRESHLLNNEDLNQAKAIYGGWLLLAPEGTHFDNPLHRSRKWQRRFFILYEHGLLRYALDEMPSTLPQGTINMNLCLEVMDGEAHTGQKNSLCLLGADGEHFIRAECREVIHGWQEALTVYPRTNKQNQKKKRKVEPPTPQAELTESCCLSTGSMNGHPEPGPAKVTVTSSGGGSVPCLPSSIAGAQRIPGPRAGLWQEEGGRWGGRAPHLPFSRSASCLSQLGGAEPAAPPTAPQNDGGALPSGRKVRVESGYFSLEKAKSEPSTPPPQPPQHLPLTPSVSMGAPGSRYETTPSPSPTSPSPSPDVPPSPGYSAVSSSQSSPEAELAPRREGRGGRGAAVTLDYAALADAPRARRLSSREAFRADRKRQELQARGRSPGREEVVRLFGEERRRSQVIGRFEEGQPAERMDTSACLEVCTTDTTPSPVPRQGRGDKHCLANRQEMSLDTGKDRSTSDLSGSSHSSTFRRAKSLDRRITESCMTPDLLNFKKGWMTKLYDDGTWKKHWFVLTDQSLRYYRDSVAEEASDLDGEVDLSSCYNVTEFSVQRNYGFQILSNHGVCTLSAMTSGIRRNWIQAIMKNVRPTIAPDVTRSLPEEKVGVVLEPQARSNVPPPPTPPPAADGAPDTRGKGRVQERRRREGRSKTCDWPEGSEPADLSSAPPSSSSSSSTASSSSSSASSPVSTTTSSPQTSSSAAPPRPAGEGRRTTPVAMTIGRTEVDCPRPTAAATPDPDGRVGTGDVRGEIEERWHRVETTPLREEKQVPIASTLGEGASPGPQRLPPHELAALLDRELGQKQKELDRLQEQNSRLQEQLEDARGRQQSAREGYILQSAPSPVPPPSSSATSPSSSPLRTLPWQRPPKPNQDQQGASSSEALTPQQQLRALRRSYTEARDAAERHGADAQALQDKMAAAAAEVRAAEEAAARVRGELRLEQERRRDQEEEWQRGEAALRAQLCDGEQRLREAEAGLLERGQALRLLEQQQALQRDRLREAERLQDRLREATVRLAAAEEAHGLREERLRREQRCLQESHQRERQSLGRRLAEAEEACREAEDRLAEAEDRVGALLRAGDAEDNDPEEEPRLKEELARRAEADAEAEALRETVRLLLEERDQLARRCQELQNQIAEADREVGELRGRLRAERAGHGALELAYEQAARELQEIGQLLREKEEEIRRTRETYERLVERKEEDLKEALVKMAALGSSLEETEQRLKAKEELLCQVRQGLLCPREPCRAEADLQAKLALAGDRIAELEHSLSALQLGYADLRMDRRRVQEEQAQEVPGEILETSASFPAATDLSLVPESVSRTYDSSDGRESVAKRRRIRFSSIQCQKYMTSEVLDTSHMDSTSIELSQEISPDTTQDLDSPEGPTMSEVPFPYSSDPEKFISIIRALETKLLVTEEKLRNLTQKLEEQHPVRTADLSVSDLQKSDARPLHEPVCDGQRGCQNSAAYSQYTMALECVETSREKVRAILSGSSETLDSQLESLSEIENQLFNASRYIREGEKRVEESSSERHHSPPQQTCCSEDLDEESGRLFAKTLSFEAGVLSKMALLIHKPKSDLTVGLREICKEVENIERGDSDCLAIVYADVLTRKLMLESEFWKDVENVEAKCEISQTKGSSREESMPADVKTTAVFNTIMKAELAYSVQNLKTFYEEKFKLLRRELSEAHNNLRQREVVLKEIFEAFQRPDLKNVISDVRNEYFSDQQMSADIDPPPDLAPYTEQIEMQEARNLAEEILTRHLGTLPSCSVDSAESQQPPNAHETLAAELQRQATVLRGFVQEIESGASGNPALANLLRAVACPRTASSLCMREALLQAQVAYVACKLRSVHEQDLRRCRQAGRSMEDLVHQHARDVAAIRDGCETSLREDSARFAQTVAALREENHALRGQVEELARLGESSRGQAEALGQSQRRAEDECAAAELALAEAVSGGQRQVALLLADMEGAEERHQAHVRILEEHFQEGVRELRHIQAGELHELHARYADTVRCLQESQRGGEGPERDEEADAPPCLMEEEEEVKEDMERDVVEEVKKEVEVRVEETEVKSDEDPMLALKDRIQELETQMYTMRDELENKHLEGDVSSLREKYQRDFDSLKATCERGFVAMEETHHKVVEDLQRQHQREVSKLLEERERLLAEETAATIAAIEAMKNAHKEELEKNQRSQFSGQNSDIDELRIQYEQELQSIHRELEVLSEQYSQKCLENAHLSQALEAERQALCQCQRENQELNAHNQELNNRLTTEITRMRSCLSGETPSPLSQGKDLYELEVLLRIKESEIQYLKQEIHSLKDELQSALRDKKYATDKYKGIYTELSIVKAKADCDISRLKEKLLVATEALGERTVDGTVAPGYDIMKSKSNPDFLKKERSAISRQYRGIRSKSVMEQVSWDS